MNILDKKVDLENKRRQTLNEAQGFSVLGDSTWSVTQSEIRSIFSSFAIEDGTGNCLSYTRLLDVWREIWIAHGNTRPMPAGVKQALMEEFEKHARTTGIILWKEFIANYQRIWGYATETKHMKPVRM